MKDFLRKFFGKQYYPLNKIYISKQRLIDNYTILENTVPNIHIAPVLKSNAYGHGLTPVAKILDSFNPAFFCVDSMYEAYELLKAGIKSRILIMGYVHPENLKVKKLPFSFAVSDYSLLESLDTYQKGAKIHIKVDTGMNRLGIQMRELPEFLKKLKTYKNIQTEGLMTHFASPENENHPQTKKQIENFHYATKLVKEFGYNPAWIHASASDGLLNLHKQNLLPFCTMVRAGKALYGVGVPIKSGLGLKPVARVASTIIQIKEIEKGEMVGYGATFTAQKKVRIAVLPIGYYDGVDRRLSNKGFVKVQDVFCPIIGRVSMNMTTIDVSRAKEANVGDEVVVFSDEARDKNSIDNAAKLCDTIPLDLLVRLAAATKRIIV